MRSSHSHIIEADSSKWELKHTMIFIDFAAFRSGRGGGGGGGGGGRKHCLGFRV